MFLPRLSLKSPRACIVYIENVRNLTLKNIFRVTDNDTKNSSSCVIKSDIHKRLITYSANKITLAKIFFY